MTGAILAAARLDAVVEAAKALGHPGRLRILAMLRGGPLCVCQITAALGLSGSTVSAHLSDLRRAGLVTEQ
jgi:ArsR family transcriptional regulator